MCCWPPPPRRHHGQHTEFERWWRWWWWWWWWWYWSSSPDFERLTKTKLIIKVIPFWIVWLRHLYSQFAFQLVGWAGKEVWKKWGKTGGEREVGNLKFDKKNGATNYIKAAQTHISEGVAKRFFWFSIEMGNTTRPEQHNFLRESLKKAHNVIFDLNHHFFYQKEFPIRKYDLARLFFDSLLWLHPWPNPAKVLHTLC